MKLKIRVDQTFLSKHTRRQFLFYSAMGAIGTLAHYAVLILLVSLSGLRPVWASTSGYIVGALTNYFLNYKYTFKSTKDHDSTLAKFLLVAAFGAGINYLVMWIGTELFKVYYMFMQLLSTSLVLVINFGINKIWTFGTNNEK